MADMDEKTAIAFEQWQETQKTEAAGQAPGENETSTATAPESEEDRIARAVQDALAKERERVGAAAPQSLVPNHAGGIGVDNHEATWSQYDQEQANAGQHPLQNQ
jgi:hypothetical protein